MDARYDENPLLTMGFTEKKTVGDGPVNPSPPPTHSHYPILQGLDTYETLERTIGADGYTLTATIDVLRRLGDWQRALPLLDRLAALGIPADKGLRTSTNAVVSAMGADNFGRARKLVERAEEEWGVRGDTVTYGTLLLSASERLPPPVPLSTVSAAAAAAASSAEAEVTREGGGLEGAGMGKIGGVERVRRVRRVRKMRGVEGGRAGGESRGEGAGEVGAIVEGGEGAEEGVAAEREWETVSLLRSAAFVRAVPSESCLNMVLFRLARNGSWEEARAFVEAIERLGLRVSRNQASFVC